jgi:5,10-methylenetetrahydromethanopterin reductase
MSAAALAARVDALKACEAESNGDTRMKFGIMGPADVTGVARAVRAEQLGYDALWFGDSPMIYSDVFVVMALAAQATKKVTVGTGVAVAGIRMAHTAAASFATVNRVAPGRVRAGLGTGATGYQLIGVDWTPVKQAELKTYALTLKGLMAGKEVDFEFLGEKRPARFLMLEQGFINCDDPIPLFLAAMGPKGQELAGEIADGIYESWGPFHDIDNLKQRLAAGAAKSGRDLDGFAIYGEGGIILLEPGDDLTSDRIINEAGPLVAIILHHFYNTMGAAAADAMPFLAPLWKDYCAMMDAWPDKRTHHYRKFAGHGVYIHPEERRFVRPELIQMFTTVGRPEEIVEKLRTWEAGGITHVNLFCTPENAERRMEQFAKHVLKRL